MYETLLSEAYNECIEVVEYPFKGRIKGLYYDNTIGVLAHTTSAEKACILAEELGHYHTSVGDILNQDQLMNRIQENRARRWGYEKLVPLDKLITAYRSGSRTEYELAEALGITVSFLASAIEHYSIKYGTHYRVGKYWVHFDPVRIFECYNGHKD